MDALVNFDQRDQLAEDVGDVSAIDLVDEEGEPLDVATFDGRPWRGAVDIVTAGYPCQPFSVAGKRRGADDPRHLGLIEPRVEALIAATGIDFRIGGNRAFYVPAHDYVQVPPPQAYFEPINWHRTALHELGHASGAPHRLNRDLSGSFGSKKYAFEELIAEINAAFCCASLGITPTVRHADYIGSWLEVLREDNRAIVRAASQASKAADWLLAFAPDDADQTSRVEPACDRRVA
ncbi:MULTISPECIES: zincin-like metallopeptidase domain-containing protein [Actibacterium]|uniref:Antirestriction protein ArdC n=1 Tax=Actibacterium naphthalenivorans TaxID=1614693 RepID=A0A840CJ93_9RHOB|nr:antirestriction protein ArdC [Actibacterium naphthalenivorans]